MTAEKTRLVYTAGTFSLSDDLAVCRRLIVTASVLRLPTTQLYQNERSNPAKTFLGYVGLFINDYCHEIKAIEFDPQVVLIWDNPAIQLYYSVLCTGINNNQVVQALGAAMTPPAAVILFPNSPAPFPGCPFTTLKFKLQQGVRLSISAIGEEAIACDGIVPAATLPDISPPPTKYPADRDRALDPARSIPEPDEFPGDSAPATADDPDLSFSAVTCTLSFDAFRSDIPGVAEAVSFIVPNSSYVSAFVDIVGPGSVYYARSNGNLGMITLAGPFNPGAIVITFANFSNSCV